MKHGITPLLAETLVALNAAIEATPMEDRHIFDFCLSPYYAQDQSAKGKKRRADALARHLARRAEVRP